MKKAILSAIASGVFILALVFSMNTSTVSFSEEAFADGTCCDESGAHCIVSGLVISGAYYKSSGSCGGSIGDAD